MSLAFDESKCTIPGNPQKITSLDIPCAVPSPPTAVFEVQFDIPTPPPHVFGLGCREPILEVTSKHDGGLTHATGKIEFPDGDYCKPKFEIDVSVDCATLGPSDLHKDITVLAKPEHPGYFDLYVLPDPYHPCSYILDLDIAIPDMCASITPENGDVRVCPTSSMGSDGCGDEGRVIGVVRTTVEQPDPAVCDYNLKVDVDFADMCPSFTETEGDVTTPTATVGHTTVTINQPDPDICAFDFKVDVSLEDFDCSFFTPVKGDVTKAKDGTDKTTITIEPNHDGPGCSFKVDVDFKCPALHVGTNEIAWNGTYDPALDTGDDPTINMWSSTDDNCDNTINLQLTVPRPLLDGVDGDLNIADGIDIDATSGEITLSRTIVTFTKGVATGWVTDPNPPVIQPNQNVTLLKKTGGPDGNNCITVDEQQLHFFGSIP